MTANEAGLRQHQTRRACYKRLLKGVARACGALALRRDSSGSARLCAALAGGPHCYGERLPCLHWLWRRARCGTGFRARGKVGRAGKRLAWGLDAPWEVLAQRYHELG
jgi:hypothetical protein